MGEQVFSWHALAPYPGWAVFSQELEVFFNFITSSIRDAKVTRIGIKYVNALNSENHGIASLKDLALDISIAENSYDGPFNFNYQKTVNDMTAVTRIASPEFVTGSPVPFSFLVDIDVFTKDVFSCEKPNQMLDWAAAAHDLLKEEYFSLLRKSTLERLVVQTC